MAYCMVLEQILLKFWFLINSKILDENFSDDAKENNNHYWTIRTSNQLMWGAELMPRPPF